MLKSPSISSLYNKEKDTAFYYSSLLISQKTFFGCNGSNSNFLQVCTNIDIDGLLNDNYRKHNP